MKPRIEEAALPHCLFVAPKIAALPNDCSGKRSAAGAIALQIAFCFWFSNSAIAQPALSSPGIVSGSSVGGIDCTASKDEKEQPPQDGTNFPDSTGDLDDSDGALDDLSAHSSRRNNQDSPHFSEIDRDAVSLRAPGSVPIRLVPVYCFYCLHAHIRERAPPSAVASAKGDHDSLQHALWNAVEKGKR